MTHASEDFVAAHFCCSVQTLESAAGNALLHAAVGRIVALMALTPYSGGKLLVSGKTSLGDSSSRLTSTAIRCQLRP